jgi:nickel-dependent lactate racemase
VSNVNVRITYGDKNLYFNIPTKNFCYLAEPRMVSASENETTSLLYSLHNPIGVTSLAESLKRGMKVLILTDDNTRPTPKREILSLLIAELNEIGIRNDDITILIALGTHRYMSKDEIRATFGADIASNIKIINHEWADPQQLIDLGLTPNGTKIVVNKKVRETNFIIGVGSIVPHSEAGWSGGGKIVQPGICGWETTAATHLLAAKDPNYLQIAGSINNPIRHEIECIATRVGLNFIINVIIGPKGKIYKTVCGDPIAAHRKGVQYAKKIYECNIPELADIVIVSAYPADLDYWQGDKPVTYAMRGLKKGGTVILVGRFPEGISNSHPILEKYGRCSYKEIYELSKENYIEDQVGMAALFIHAHHKEKASIICVSEGLTLEQKQNLAFIPAENTEQAIKLAFHYQGESAKIGIIDYGGDLLPVLQSQNG